MTVNINSRKCAEAMWFLHEWALVIFVRIHWRRCWKKKPEVMMCCCCFAAFTFNSQSLWQVCTLKHTFLFSHDNEVSPDRFLPNCSRNYHLLLPISATSFILSIHLLFNYNLLASIAEPLWKRGKKHTHNNCIRTNCLGLTQLVMNVLLSVADQAEGSQMWWYTEVICWYCFHCLVAFVTVLMKYFQVQLCGCVFVWERQWAAAKIYCCLLKRCDAQCRFFCIFVFVEK